MSRLALLVAFAVAASGCSAIINPDSDRFGVDPDTDAGPGVMLMDAGDVDAAGFDAGPEVGDDAGPPGDPDAGCPGARCESGVLRDCNGDMVTCDLGCAPGDEPRCAEMIPSNVPADLWQADAPELDLDEPGSIGFDTTACTSMMARSMVVTQAGGDEVCVLIVRTLRVRSNVVLRAFGSRPLVIMAAEEVRVDVNGAIDVSSYFTGDTEGALGAGGPRGSAPGRREGRVPGDDGVHAGSFEDGGGGGGGYCGDGGDGGDGGGGAFGGRGSVAMGGGLLTPLLAGNAGGFGPGAMSAISPGSRGNIGLGGAGGGALQISTPGVIRIDGFLGAGGGAALGGRNRNGGGTGGNWGAGGGGGSGGAILLEAPEILFGTDWAITTSGGGGGGGAGQFRSGGDGQNGINTLGRALGGDGGDGTYGGDGGDSGGGDTDPGLDGGDRAVGSGNGGGGGGGVGCLAMRDLDGSLPASIRPRLSGRTDTAFRTAPIMLR